MKPINQVRILVNVIYIASFITLLVAFSLLYA
jgi:heme/copper-type cytochrome/quinol oxidase subunit 2